MALDSYLDDEERRQLRRQFSEIAELAGGLAHEIKNPLSTIHMLMEVMSEDVRDGESPRDRRMLTRIQTVQRECRRLEETLDAFLQFARLGEIDAAEGNLNDVVREFVEFYLPEANDHGVELSPHLASNLPAVRIDKSLFRQVLMNLALNAQQAMPSGGLLELQTWTKDGRVCLSMIDNGSGISETTREKMVEVFFSTKPNGSGLGLPTVRRIVEAHHGTISGESELGRGTRFTISLPAAE
ncbi:MAG: PAS domain-containing sensor histidine kinase [Planctomycetaceae bacterium]